MESKASRCILNFLWKRVFGQDFKLKRGVENPNNHVFQLLSCIMQQTRQRTMGLRFK